MNIFWKNKFFVKYEYFLFGIFIFLRMIFDFFKKNKFLMDLCKLQVLMYIFKDDMIVFVYFKRKKFYYIKG